MSSTENNLRYESFIWSLGNTSFRTKNFNLSIERQLDLLDEFWKEPKNVDQKWSRNKQIHKKYYEWISEKWFHSGMSPNPEKDAREITAGLIPLGLIDNERRLTEAGKVLLEVFKSKDFSSDNFLKIDKDSFIYFKQLLKTSINVGKHTVRPLLVLFHLIEKFEFLKFDEFKYLLPLCLDDNSLKEVCSNISDLRQNKILIEDIILKIILNKQNYKDALKVFMNNKITQDLFIKVGLNRKSRTGKAYDSLYFPVFISLRKVVLEDNDEEIVNLFNNVKSLNLSKYWSKYLFQTNSVLRLAKFKREGFKKVRIFNVKNEDELRFEFFKLMHLFKTISTLNDYFDLNRRYFKLCDFFLFRDNRVSLDVLPKAYVDCFCDSLEKMLFVDLSNKLPLDLELSEICEAFRRPKESLLCANINKKFGLNISTTESIDKFISTERYTRFNNLLKKKFPKSTIKELFELFKSRKDDLIKMLVTDDADIPTIFEYVVGIAWYYISEQKGDVLSYMKLSLDADLLPKTHAGGGTADIVWEYQKSEYYPKHTLLIEATLTEKNTQRRSEMEPVSRHLGDFLINSKTESYSMFVSTYLDKNVVSDFRSRKHYTHYGSDGEVTGLKIIPVSTDEVITILNNDLKYKEIYHMFEEAYQSDVSPIEWRAVRL